MTSLESVLHSLKYMSKRAKFIVETKIPDFEKYVAKRDEYERYFRQCSGKSFHIVFMTEGIEPGKTALFLACFDNQEDTDKFHKLCEGSEQNWSEEHSADQMADAMMTTCSEDFNRLSGQ